MSLGQRAELGRRIDMYALRIQEGMPTQESERLIRTLDIGYKLHDGRDRQHTTVAQLISEHPAHERLVKEWFGLLYQFESAVRDGDDSRAVKLRTSLVGFVERMMM